MNLVLLGPPGSGKGTQAEKIAKEFNLKVFSAGDILRQLSVRETPLGNEVRKILGRGELVPEAIMEEILTDFLDQESKRGILFDGYPRNLEQAKILTSHLEKLGGVSLAIYLRVRPEIVVKRLILRRICPKCSAVYNLETKPPKKENVCDSCGVELICREDEKPAAIRKRLAVFEEQTLPVLDFFEKEGKLVVINGEASIEEVYKEVKRKIQEICE
ncbi:nucleoside monophosphate kinase [Candidatus Shapirobacteria bacterium]|nr:nucleoside monophosphate kinase [Candidatus Shapirobacteria bacterium]